MIGQAKSEGKQLVLPNEIISAWEAFQQDPNIANANKLMDDPIFAAMFNECKPGGGHYEIDRKYKFLRGE